MLLKQIFSSLPYGRAINMSVPFVCLSRRLFLRESVEKVPVSGISGSKSLCIYILNTCFSCPAVYTSTIGKGPMMGQTLYFKLNKLRRLFIRRLSESECGSLIFCGAPSVIDEGSSILCHLQM